MCFVEELGASMTQAEKGQSQARGHSLSSYVPTNEVIALGSKVRDSSVHC